MNEPKESPPTIIIIAVIVIIGSMFFGLHATGVRKNSFIRELEKACNIGCNPHGFELLDTTGKTEDIKCWCLPKDRQSYKFDGYVK